MLVSPFFLMLPKSNFLFVLLVHVKPKRDRGSEPYSDKSWVRQAHRVAQLVSDRACDSREDVRIPLREKRRGPPLAERILDYSSANSAYDSVDHPPDGAVPHVFALSNAPLSSRADVATERQERKGECPVSFLADAGVLFDWVPEQRTDCAPAECPPRETGALEPVGTLTLEDVPEGASAHPVDVRHHKAPGGIHPCLYSVVASEERRHSDPGVGAELEELLCGAFETLVLFLLLGSRFGGVGEWRLCLDYEASENASVVVDRGEHVDGWDGEKGRGWIAVTRFFFCIDRCFLNY